MRVEAAAARPPSIARTTSRTRSRRRVRACARWTHASSPCTRARRGTAHARCLDAASSHRALGTRIRVIGVVVVVVVERITDMHARAIASSSVAHARPGSTRHARGGNGESVTSTSRPAARVRGKRAVARAVAPADEGERDVTDIEINLGRAAMLGFLGTTLGDVITRGEGPIEQLEDEAAYVINHVNPVDLARDALEVAGIYVESVILVWLLLGCALLLGVSQGMRNPIRTVSGRTTKQRSEAAFGEIEKAYETNVKEQKPYELFNGRLAMLGSAFAFVGDVRTGGLGPLEQVQNEVGIPVIDEEIFAVIFLGGVALNVVSTGITAFRRAYAKGRE